MLSTNELGIMCIKTFFLQVIPKTDCVKINIIIGEPYWLKPFSNKIKTKCYEHFLIIDPVFVLSP